MTSLLIDRLEYYSMVLLDIPHCQQSSTSMIQATKDQKPSFAVYICHQPLDTRLQKLFIKILSHVGKFAYLPLACLCATDQTILGPEFARAIYYLQQPHYQHDSGFSDQMMTRI